MLNIKTVLVPVDFDEPSERALDYALGLARRLDAAVIVMHAYEIPVYGFPDGAVVATAEVAARISAGLQVALDAMVAKRSTSGIHVTSLLRDGRAWEEVGKAAEEVRADLIVIGTHGRRGLSRVFLGSVAEKVLRTATRPVLVVREPGVA